MPASSSRLVCVCLIVGSLGFITVAASGRSQAALAATSPSTFAVGIPTVVDPVRAVGEPDIVVDNNKNALITGPGGTGTQTSFFWHTRDHGLTYRLLGASGGHYICAGSGGGDSLGVKDRVTNDIYLTDQEALADLGLSKLNGNTNTLTATECANAPAAGADRPFEAVIPTNNAVTPQSVADGKKPIVYLSWACQGCAGGVQNSGLAFGWSDDGVTWHAADPGVIQDNLVTNDFQEGNTLSAFEWHGSMVADPTTGDVFTAISCNPGNGCPNKSGKNEIGVAVGVPQAAPISASNLGQFASLSYQTACAGVVGCNEEGSLFPVLSMDSKHTLYEMWSEGNGFATPSAPFANEDWHIYYAYSLDTASDTHKHTIWSAPIRVDTGLAVGTFGWMAAGGANKLGFVFLGSDRREHPSLADTSRQWHPYMAVTTNATSAQPVFQQAQVGIGPNHIGDICLQGTVGCVQNVGNRNMADFISADIGPNGALQATWANDSNQLSTKPSTLIPGLPITETAVQVGGPNLLGTGTIRDGRFSTVPTTNGVSAAFNNAFYPVDGGTTNYPQLDIRASRVTFDGSNVVVQVKVGNASSLLSPDTTNQTHVWWLTTWQYNHQIYYAKAESDSGGAIACTAGVPKTYDRPGLNGQTVATLADYSGGTAVSGCTLHGNVFTITVPVADVGSPPNQAVLESTALYSVLDNGAPPAVGPGPGNVPTVVDVTRAYDALLAASANGAPAAPLAAGLVPAAGLAALIVYRRRRGGLGSLTG